jgi:23S rRNA (guanine745-N1)-methyltransferase
VERLGLLSVAGDKDLRLEETLGDRFARAGQNLVEISLTLGHKEVEAVVGMGPSAWHTEPAALTETVRALPDPMPVRAAFRITEWRKRPH